LKVKKLANQWKPLARFVMMASRMVTHPLLTFLTMTGLVTVVVTVDVVEFTTVVVVTTVVVEVRVVVVVYVTGLVTV